MRRLLVIALTVIVFLALAGWGALQSQSFWHWGGREVVNFAQDRVHGQLRVGSVQGHPLMGFTFSDVTLAWNQGEILHLDRLDLRFSLWSFIKLRPVIAELVLVHPRLTLRQDQAGRWEVAGVLKKRPPPPFKSLDFSQILIRRGQVSVNRSGATQHYTDLNLELHLTVLHPKRPNQEILVRRASLMAGTPLGRFGLEGSFTYARDRLRLDSLEVKSGDAVLASLSSPGYLGPGEKARLAFEVGPLPGGLLHRLWAPWPENCAIDGKFRLAVQNLSRFDLNGAARLQQAALDLKGSLSREKDGWVYDLNAKSAGLRPELLQPFAPQWAARLKNLSPVGAQLTLQGAGLAWPPERLDWTLETGAVRAQGISVEHLKLRLAGNSREQKLEGRLRSNFGQLTLDAAGPLLASRKGDLKIETKNFQPARLGLAQAGETRLDGKFSGTFTCPEPGGFKSLQLAGNLEGRGQVRQELLEDFRARLSWQQPKLEIPQAHLRLGTLTAEFSGASDGGRLNWKFKGSLAPGAPRPYLPVATRGRVELSGALTGAFQAPQWALQGGGSGLALDGFSLKSFTFKASAAGWTPASGDLDLQGLGLRTPAAVFSQARLSARGEANLWQLQFTASGPQELRAEIAGTADLRSRPISLTLPQCAWHSPGYALANRGPVQLRLLPGLQQAAGAFKINGGDLDLKLEAQGTRLAGQVQVRHLPARLFSRLGAPLKGTIDGQGSVTGEPGAPQIQGQISWSQGQVGEFPFQSLRTSIDFNQGLLKVDGRLEEKPSGPRLLWEGQVPLRLSLIPLQCSLGDRNLDLTVKGEQANLALLTAIPQVQSAEGSLDLLAHWRGNPRHPEVSGRVGWGAGSIKLRVAGLPYRLQPGAILIQNSKITLPELVVESGGTLRLHGDVTLQGFTPSRVKLQGQAQNFLALKREGTQIVANADLALSGPWDAASLSGQILIPKATFATSFFQSGPHPDIILVNRPKAPEPGAAPDSLVFWRNLRSDLTLQSAGKVWIKNKDLRVAMQGSLKVIKAPAQERLAVAGVLRAEEGTIDIHGRPFKVTEGSVTLPGKPGQPGILEGRAVSEMTDITLYLNISGPTNKPVVRLSSNPPMPSPDLLSYLIFGRPAATLNRDEYTSLGQQALGILGGISAKKLQELLGKDFPLVGNVTMQSSKETLGVTKPLTKELSVSFERKTNPLYRDDPNQVRLEYKVNKYMSLQSTMGQRNTGGDVLFNYDF